MKHFDERRREFTPYGFTCEVWEAIPMRRPDRHDEIEINFIDCGTLTYMLGGRLINIPPKTLTVFWGAVPHQIVDHANVSFYHVMTIPFGTFLEWGVDELRTRLVMGHAVSESDLTRATDDVYHFKRWTTDLGHKESNLHDIVLIEVQARMMRLARSLINCSESPRIENNHRPPNLKKAELMANFVARNYASRIQVNDIAEFVSLHPDYASTLFKQTYGITLNAFVTRHRIADAQRRLLTTADQILEVSLAAGFDSLSRFNRAFKELTTVTPREYRKQYHRQPSRRTPIS